MSTDESKPTLGDLAGNPNFDAEVEERLRAAGVEPPAAVIAKESHKTVERATGAANPNRVGLGQSLNMAREARPPYTSKTYDTQIMSRLMSGYGPALTWFHHLNRAQLGGAEVAVYTRHHTEPFRGRIAPEPKLSELDQDSATRLRTITLVPKTGGAHAKQITIDIAEIIGLAEQLSAKTEEQT